MTKTVTSATTGTPFADIVARMRDNRHSCTVVAELDRPVGIITERDVLLAFAGLLEDNESVPASAADIMSSPPVTITEDATLFEALVIANSYKIRHLPVVRRDGGLVGVLSYTDLVQAHFKQLDASTESLNRAILEKNAELVAANAQLQSLSLTDPLLNVGNRRAMEVDLQHAFATAGRYQQTLSVLLMDIDFFKAYNDHYGHSAGDEALISVASVIKNSLRNCERIYRYGGEEFLAILPATGLDGAIIAAERLLDTLEHEAIEHAGSPLGQVSLSIGVATMRADSLPDSVDILIEEADKQLYAAKEAGRNGVRPAALGEKRKSA